VSGLAGFVIAALAIAVGLLIASQLGWIRVQAR
jgi:hypothetical protein